MLYDIASRINKENEKHKLVIDDEHKYDINNSAAAVIAIQSIVKQGKNANMNDEDQIEQLYKIITVGLGKEAADYIKEQNVTIPALNTIVSAISAATINETLEEFEEENKKAEEEQKNTPSE